MSPHLICLQASFKIPKGPSLGLLGQGHRQAYTVDCTLLQSYQNNFDFFEPDRQASLPSVPCNIFENLSIQLTKKRKREVHFLCTVAHTEFCALKMLCREREKFHNLQFALCTKFCVCVPQCEGNEFLSFFSWLTKWREFPKCYMAHLVKVLACLARKSQSYFDSFVTGFFFKKKPPFFKKKKRQ